MSVVIFTKDTLRASVEAATGGKVTVLYDSKGYPSYMVVIPKFSLQDIDSGLGTGVHPAFIVNGVEKSQIFIGQYQARVYDGSACSLPGVGPTVSVSFEQALSYCAVKGPGWHLMTNAEWSAVALWCWKNGFMPRGNNNYGRDASITYETGVRVDGGAPGDTSGTPRTLTGTGPASWRHDNTYTGIADINGNIWEWIGGLRLVDGEIQIIPDNNAANNTISQASNSTAWRAILASNGSLVTPGTTGTCKYDSVNAGNSGNVGPAQLDDVVDNSNYNNGYTDNTFQSLGADTGITPPSILKALALYPIATSLGDDIMWVRNYGERIGIRGGGWASGSDAGVFALHLDILRSIADPELGFRAACVL